MKRNALHICCLWLTAVVLCSCSRRAEEARWLGMIEEAWQASETDLDRASEMAGAMADSVFLASECVRMHYDLLRIRIRDKKDCIPTSADSIRQVVRYMDRHGSERDRMRAYYYMGSVFRDLHDSPRAIVNFMKSARLAEESREADTLMLIKCHAQLGGLYQQQLNYEEGLAEALKEYELAEKVGRVTPWILMDVEAAYNMVGNHKKRLEYTDMAYELMVRDSSLPIRPGIQTTMLTIYSVEKRKDRADSLLQVVKAIPAHKRPHNYNRSIGQYYSSFGQPDSAAKYDLRQLETTKLTGSKMWSAARLMHYYHDKGDDREAMRYARIYQKANDSLSVERQFEQTKKARGEYLYQQDQEREDALQRRNALLRLWLSMGVGVGGIAILGLVSYFLFRRNRMLEDLVRKDLQIALSQEALRKRSEDLAKAEQEVDELSSLLEQREADLATRMAQNRQLMKYALTEQSGVDATEVVKAVRAVAERREKLAEGAWKELFAAVDTLFPEFNAEVQAKVDRLTEENLKTCDLLNIGMTNPQIQCLMAIPRQTAWYRSKKMENKLGDSLSVKISE